MKMEITPMKFEPEQELQALKNTLSPSQLRALDDLDFFWELRRTEVQQIAGISTRPIPLIIGPSGAGKTHLVRKFAEEKNIALWSINLNNWVVRGAKSEASLPVLARFIQENSCGIICIDEVDKLTRNLAAETSWTADCQCEAFTLLDGDERLLSMEWPREVLEKFQSNYLLVGIGAWQDITGNRKSHRHCGFGKVEDAKMDLAEAIKKQNGIADELFFRFNERIIFIDPPNRDEFILRIRAIRDELKLPSLSEEKLSSLASQAVESNRHFRFLENYVGDLLKESNYLEGKNYSREFLDGVFAPPPKSKISQEKLTKDFDLFKIELKNFAEACAEFESAVLRREAEWLNEMKIRPSILLGVKLGRNNLYGDLAGQIRQLQEAVVTWSIESSPFEQRRICESIIINDGHAFFETIRGHLRTHSEVGEKFHHAAMRAYAAFHKVELIHEHIMNRTDPKF